MGTRQRSAARIASLVREAATLDPQRVDALYGLEPVFEPDATGAGALIGEFVEIQCPWCGEVSGLNVDLTAVATISGDLTFIEDCQVCCRPMELEFELSENGELREVAVRRSD